MQNNELKENAINELFELIAALKTPEDCELLFGDLCTVKEIEQMAQRVGAAKLLIDGKTYKEVTEIFDISSATLSRVSRCVRYGDGYNTFLKKKEF